MQIYFEKKLPRFKNHKGTIPSTFDFHFFENVNFSKNSEFCKSAIACFY